MSLLLAVALFTGVDLYFLKDSPNLLVRVVPPALVDNIVLYYTFSGEKWDSVSVQGTGKYFDAVIIPPETLNIVGVYFISYANKIGDVDNNQGNLYLYEVKKSPRMLMPFSIADLEIVLKQARKKIVARHHVDEAITLLDYVEGMLKIMPFINGSNIELKKKLLETEVNDLRKMLR